MSDQQFTIGHHVKLDDGEFWLPVRFVKQSTLHEEPTTGDIFLDNEEFVELRNAKGEARFAILNSERTATSRDVGPCKGIKPYFWKGTTNGNEVSNEAPRG